MPRWPVVFSRAARLSSFGSILVAALSSCNEPQASNRNGLTGRVDLVPSYPLDAAIVTATIPVDGARIRVVRPPSTVILDSTVAFPSTSNEISLSLSIPLEARSEELIIRLELSGGGRPLFAGEDRVVVRDVSGGPVSPTLQLSYVGPGANVASLELSPRDTTLGLGATFTFGVSAFDSNEQVIPEFYARWSTSNPAIGVSLTGELTAPSTRGEVLLRIRTINGIADSTLVRFSPPPASLAIADGNAQTGVAGSVLPEPLVVIVRASDNQGVPGVPVHFAGAGGATVQNADVVTDASGQASTTGTLGTAAGPQGFQASVAGLPTVSFTATATAATPSQLIIVSGNQQSGPVSTALPAPFVVGVTDAFQNAVPGITIAWQVTSGAGALTAPTSTTDAQGRAQVGYTLGSIAGANTVTGSVPAVPSIPALTFTATAVPLAPTQLIAVSGTGQSVAIGQNTAQPVVVSVRDALGNPVSGAAVAWQVVSGGGSVTTATSTSNASGLAQIGYRAGTTATVALVMASLPSGPSGSTYPIPIRILSGAAVSMTRFSGNWQSVAQGATSQPLMVAALDQGGNAVAGAAVNWVNIFSFAGSLVKVVPSTDARGLAEASYIPAIIPSGVPPAQVNAETSTDTVSFSLNDAPALQIVVAGGDRQVGPAGGRLALPLSVQVVDFGRPVGQAPVAFQVTLGGGALTTVNAITDGQGIATTDLRLGARAGPNIVVARDVQRGQVLELGAIAIADAPTTIVPFSGDGQSGAVGQTLAADLFVVVTDQFGNPVSGTQVDWSDQVGGTETPATSTTNAVGVAATRYRVGTLGQQKVRATLVANGATFEFTITGR